MIELAHMNEAQKRAYVLADNQLALNAGWDEALLRLELSDLSELVFDLGLIGFGEGELERLLAGDVQRQFAEQGLSRSRLSPQEKSQLIDHIGYEAYMWLPLYGPGEHRATSTIDLGDAPSRARTS